jgi:hypothetical protein
MGWFYLGALLGAVLSAGAVVLATEMQHGRSARRLRRRNGTLNPEAFESEIDLVEGLSHVVSEGLNVMAEAAARLSDSFGSARREAIRYGIESEGASRGHGGSSHGWYTGEEDDEPADPDNSVAPLPS